MDSAVRAHVAVRTRYADGRYTQRTGAHRRGTGIGIRGAQDKRACARLRESGGSVTIADYAGHFRRIATSSGDDVNCSRKTSRCVIVQIDRVLEQRLVVSRARAEVQRTHNLRTNRASPNKPSAGAADVDSHLAAVCRESAAVRVPLKFVSAADSKRPSEAGRRTISLVHAAIQIQEVGRQTDALRRLQCRLPAGRRAYGRRSAVGT